MLSSVYWSVFQKSGDINAYIAYREALNRVDVTDCKKRRRKEET